MRDNITRLKLAHALEKQSKGDKRKVWKDISRKISGPRQNRSTVNVSEISKNTIDGAKVLVAGKVLGNGDIDHKVTVGAYSFSSQAKSKIAGSGGKCLLLEEFMSDTKLAKGVQLIG